MMQFMKKRLAVFFLIFISNIAICHDEPRLTVIFVIDQFAYSYIPKLKQKLHGGLGFLLSKGVVYENAYYPHAKPATATGHAALNTGVFPKDHGIVANKWYGQDGKVVYFPDTGYDPATAVFDNKGTTFNFSRSPKRLRVPGISDTFVLNPKSKQKNYVYSLSLKDRSAIATAGRLGKAIWFEGKNGCFTSSKAYFDKLPDWIDEFNKEKAIYDMKTVKWEPAYALNSSLYKFKDAFNYKFSESKSMIDKEVKIFDPGKKYSYKGFALTPYANYILADLAERCIENVLAGQKENRLVLWVSFSTLDKLGHVFGPNAAESIDVIYHIDKIIKKFMKNVQRIIKKGAKLFVVTADHGVCPIPEMLNKRGLKFAVRIDEKKLHQNLNKFIEENCDVKNLIIKLMNNQLYVNKFIFDALKKYKQDEVIVAVKKYLAGIKGIKHVWTYNELKNKTFKSDTIGSFYKNQLYPGRSGDFIIAVDPYCQLSDYPAGTSHSSPYQYNTHVPLIIYQKDEFEDKAIKERVSMLRFSNSLAEILKVPKSPASMFNIFPGLFESKY